MSTTTEDATFTQAQVDEKVAAAVAAAVAPLQEKIEELANAAGENEVQQAVATATAELETKLAEVQGQLDTTVAELEAQKAETQAVHDFFATAIEAQEAEKEAAARKDERLAQIASTVTLPEEYLSEHADRFAAMSDEDFEAQIAAWVAAGAKPAEGTKPPVETAMGGGQGPTGGAEQRGSALQHLGTLRGALSPNSL